MIYPPPNHPILSKISDTQHHALLHKGLFCERPISLTTSMTVDYLPVVASSDAEVAFLAVSVANPTDFRMKKVN